MKVILSSILTSAKRDSMSALNIRVEYFEILNTNDFLSVTASAFQYTGIQNYFTGGT